MAAIVLGDKVQVLVYCSDGNQVSVTQMTYLAGAPTGTVTDSLLAIAADLLFGPEYKTWLNTMATYVGTQIRLLRGTGSPMPQHSVASAGAGTGGTVPLPWQTRGLISYQTAFGGQAFRGRQYIPFGSTALQSVTGQLTTAAGMILDNIGTAYISTFVTPTIGGGGTIVLTPVLYHRKGYGRPPVGIGTTTTIVDFIARTGWATQRKSGFFGRANLAPF